MENETKKVRDLTAGGFFKLSKSSKQVFMMGVLRGLRYVKEYDGLKDKYVATNFSDRTNQILLSGDREVVVTFKF